MLFTALQQYDAARIEEMTREYLAGLGLDEGVLTQELGGGHTLGELVNGLTARLIAEASAEDRRRFRERQSAGIARAQQAGVPIGRPTRKQDRRFRKIREMYEHQEVTGQEAARLLGVAPSTFYRWLRQDNEKNAAKNGEKKA